MNSFPYTTKQVSEAIKKVSVGRWFEKDWDINLWGVRTPIMNSDRFNCWLGCTWYFDGIANSIVSSGTTLPGIAARIAPKNLNGCAVLVEGHHKGCWALGDHKGQYPALDQVAPVKVYRFKGKSEKLILDPKSIETGLFGIEHHQENPDMDSRTIGGYSEGCQVWQMSILYRAMLDAIRQSITTYKDVRTNSNLFSYTLLKVSDVV